MLLELSQLPIDELRGVAELAKKADASSMLPKLRVPVDCLESAPNGLTPDASDAFEEHYGKNDVTVVQFLNALTSAELEELRGTVVMVEQQVSPDEAKAAAAAGVAAPPPPPPIGYVSLGRSPALLPYSLMVPVSFLASETKRYALKLHPKRWTVGPGSRFRLHPLLPDPICGSVTDLSSGDGAPALTVSVDNGHGKEVRVSGVPVLDSAASVVQHVFLGGFIDVRYESGIKDQQARAEFKTVYVQEYVVGERLMITPLDRSVEGASMMMGQILAWDAGHGIRRPTRYEIHLEDLSSGSESSAVVDLNAFNCCRQRFQDRTAYMKAALEYCSWVRDSSTYLEDAITGIKLKSSEQLLAVEVRKADTSVELRGLASITSISDLAGPLFDPRKNRLFGSHPIQPVLIVGAAGTGKTWSMMQCTHLLAQRSCESFEAMPSPDPPLVPILIYVQQFARMLAEWPEDTPIDVTVLQQYFAREYKHQPDFLMLLTQALDMRTLIVLLDGFDEAAGRRDSVAKLMTMLVNMGLHVVASSRPEGIDVSRHSEFVILDLQPLTDAQSRDAISKQLEGFPAGKEFSDHLLGFVAVRRQHDDL